MFPKRMLGLVTTWLMMLVVQITAPAAATTNASAAVTLEGLQGTWAGAQTGQTSGGNVILTITGHSLRYQGVNTNDWYDATFTLPAGTDPLELRATVTGCLQTNDIGAVVRAIFKIEGRTLTLVGIQDRDQEPPKSFSTNKPFATPLDGTFKLAGSFAAVPDKSKAFADNTVFRYELRRIEPPRKSAEATKSK